MLAALFLTPLIVIIALWYDNYIVKQQKELQKLTPTISSTPISTSPAKEEKMLFVPYWTLTSQALDTSYDGFIYFGILPDATGIDKNDQGYLNLPTFKNLIPKNEKKYLIVRMVDNDINFKVLDDEPLEEKIIDESITIAKDYSFDALVLDLEVNALPFDTFLKKMNDFVKLFSQGSHQNNLKFYMTTHGDVFYRVRPYDLTTLSKYTDGIMIMAYDFHKAKGNPGPNFPLSGKEKYGYDFKTMINDFSKEVPKDKLMIVFGLFGYDWVVDENNQSIKQAKAVTYNEAKEKFTSRRDEKSFEMSATYDDKEGKHVVWFEDLESVNQKIKYAKTQGISSFIYWAHSYF